MHLPRAFGTYGHLDLGMGQVMWKQVVGALIGALIGAVLMVVLERAVGKEFGWTVIPLGILTGIGASLAAEKPSFVRGAFAAFLTLAAFAGGKLAASYLGQQAAERIAQVAPSEEADDDAEEEAEEVEEADSEDEAASAEEDDRAAVDAMERERSRLRLEPGASVQKNFETPQTGSTLDTVWLVVGAAIAYVLGRGSAKPEAVQEGPDAAAAGSPPTEGGSSTPEQD